MLPLFSFNRRKIEETDRRKGLPYTNFLFGEKPILRSSTQLLQNNTHTRMTQTEDNKCFCLFEFVLFTQETQGNNEKVKNLN